MTEQKYGYPFGLSCLMQVKGVLYYFIVALLWLAVGTVSATEQESTVVFCVNVEEDALTMKHRNEQ
ncbi:MAG: hypothetical protein GY702_10470 [Desulfobulbaceae bacterium]|nr:hypothetical protein [Desulfobulbaceae bacterium]